MKNLTIAFVAALTLMSFGCKKKDGAASAMAKMSDFKDDMCKCKDTACAQKVSEAMTKWSQDMAKDNKEPPKMSEEDQKKAAAIGEEMGKCMQKAMGATMEGAGSAPAPAGSDTAAGSGAAPAAAGDLPAECNDYKAAIDKLSGCDKMPQAARDALKNAFDQASASWASLPAESKAGLATACKAGADAVMQSAKTTCGW
jgi:hypothetical protein